LIDTVVTICSYSEVRYASAIFFCDRAAMAEPVTPQWFLYLSI